MKTLICSKVLTILGTSLIVAVGLAGIALSIYLFVQNKVWDAIIGNYQLTFAILFIAASCLIFITGILGLVGAATNNKCLLHTEWILLLVWFAAFIAAGVAAVLLPSRILSDGCQSTKTFGIFQELDTVSSTAIGDTNSTGFCKSSCPCYVENSTIAAELGADASADSTKANKVNDCPGWTDSNQDTVMAALELAFTCTGWCSVTPLPKIFYFSNNNRANVQPTNTCFNAFSDFFASYGKYVYIASFVFSALIIILTICVWVHICLINEYASQLKKY